MVVIIQLKRLIELLKEALMLTKLKIQNNFLKVLEKNSFRGLRALSRHFLTCKSFSGGSRSLDT